MASICRELIRLEVPSSAKCILRFVRIRGVRSAIAALLATVLFIGPGTPLLASLVLPAPIATVVAVSVSPSTVTVNPGATQTFAAVVTGSTNTSVTWSATGGSITSAGVFTAPATKGTYTITAKSVADTTKTATATVTVPITVAVAPGTTTVNPGGTQTFAATVKGTTNTAVTWAASGGSISSSGVFTAPNAAGTYTITAKSSADTTRTGTATVTVPVSVAVSPTAATVNPGMTQAFTATVKGSTNTAVTWAASGGTITSGGVFTAPTTAGTYTVTAKSSADPTKTAVATVTVPIAVSVAPASASVVSGSTQSFTATVTGTTNTAVTWSSTGGTITSAGVFTAPSTAGTYTVTAKSAADATKTASATVTVPINVKVTPSTATVAPGTNQTFAASVTGTTNSAVTWSASGGAKITSGGVFTAPATAGVYTVTAKSSADTTKTGTASVTVPITVSVSPSSSTISPGDSQTFSVTVKGTTNTAVTWSASGGSITSGGVFTAPNAAGTYTISAKSSADATKIGTATVTVPIVVAIAPGAVTINQGGTQAFSAIGTGAQNAAVVWSASAGTITSGGVYTAPVLGGNYTVIATSVADGTTIGTAFVQVPQANATISAPAMVTESQQGCYASIPSVTGGAYSWTITNGQFQSPSTNAWVLFKPTVAGSSVTLTCNAHGSDWINSTGTVTIPVAPLPVVTLTAPATTSVGVTGLSASVQSQTGMTYSWTVRGGGAITSAVNQSVVSFDAPGNSGAIQLVCSVTNAAGLTLTGTASVDVLPAANPFTGVYRPSGGQANLELALVQTQSGILGYETSYLPQNLPVSSLASKRASLQLAPSRQSIASQMPSPVDRAISYSYIQGTASGNTCALSRIPYSKAIGLGPVWPTGTLSADGTTLTLVSSASTEIYTRIPGAIAVIAQPDEVLLSPGGSVKLAPVVIGSANTQVTYEVQGNPGESIAADGSYIAPQQPGIYAVTARSVADPQQSATTIVIVTSDGLLHIQGMSPNWVFQSGTQVTVANANTNDPNHVIFSGTLSGLQLSGRWGTGPATSNYRYYATSGWQPVDVASSSSPSVGGDPVQDLQPSIGGNGSNFLGAWGAAGSFDPFGVNVQLSNMPGKLSFNDASSWNPNPDLNLLEYTGLVWSATSGTVRSSGNQFAYFALPRKTGLSLVTASSATHPDYHASFPVLVKPDRASVLPSGVYQTSQGELAIFLSSGAFPSAASSSGATPAGVILRWSIPSIPGFVQGTGSLFQTSTGYQVQGSWMGGGQTGELLLDFDSAFSSFTGYYDTLVSGVPSNHQSLNGSLTGSVRLNLAAATHQLSVGGWTQMLAMVTGTSNQEITWAVSGGSITSEGVFTAPAVTGTYSVTATSKADPTQSATWNFQVTDQPSITTLSGSYTPGGGTDSGHGFSLFQNGTQALFLGTQANLYAFQSLWPLQFQVNGNLLWDNMGDLLVVNADGSLSAQLDLINGGTIQPALSGLSWSKSTYVDPAGVLSPMYQTVQVGQQAHVAVTHAGVVQPLTAKYGTITSDGTYTAPSFPVRDVITYGTSGSISIGGTRAVIDVLQPQPLSPIGLFTTTGQAVAGVPSVQVSQQGALFVGQGTSLIPNSTQSVSLSGSIQGTVWSGSWSSDLNGQQGSFKGYFDPSGIELNLFLASSDGFPLGASYHLTMPISISLSLLPKQTTIDPTWSMNLQASLSIVGAPRADRNLNWSIQEANGGTINSPGTPNWNGTYTAPSTPGTYHVTVVPRADVTKSATSTISVGVTGFEISPDLAGIRPGGSVQFFARMASSPIPAAVTWSVQEGVGGGVITAAGVYTAPMAAGTYHVLATSPYDSTKVASVSVVVSAQARISIVISPEVATINGGGTQSFSASVTGASNKSVLWSCSAGTIDAAGLYTAPSIPGTYSVKATSVEDSTAYAVTTVVVAAGAQTKLFAYDKNGNLLNDGTRVYEWDAENRLISVTSNVTGHRSEFVYDGLGRRVEVIERNGTSLVSDTKYLWVGGDIGESRTQDGSITLQRYFGQGMIDSDGVQLFYTRDHLGSLRELVDAQQNVRARYDYDPFGRVTKIAGDRDGLFLYTGHMWHAASGLYLTRFRAYNPDLGRWISRDPLQEYSGLNFYVYVQNDSVGRVDPDGRLLIGAVVGGIIGGVTSYIAAKATGASDRDALIAAAAGAATGAVLGLLDPTEVGMATYMAAGAAAGAAGDYLGQGIANKMDGKGFNDCINTTSIGISAVGGALGGLMSFGGANALMSSGGGEFIQGAVGGLPGGAVQGAASYLGGMWNKF